MIRLSFHSQEEGEHLSHDDLSPAFSGTEKTQRALSIPAASQVILVLYNQYAIVGYLGAACPGL